MGKWQHRAREMGSLKDEKPWKRFSSSNITILIALLGVMVSLLAALLGEAGIRPQNSQEPQTLPLEKPK